MVSQGLGIAGLPMASIPGHVDGQSYAELQHSIAEVTYAKVVENLTRAVAEPADKVAREAGAVVASGSFTEVNAAFADAGWTDGLPIIPPTRSVVESFLRQVPDEPMRVIGVMAPSGSAATVLNVAINGAMAGCKPEYMPVLLAIAEVLCDPHYGAEHSGDTTGGDALIVISGPVVESLAFNCEEGALRDGSVANTSIGRFLRLYLRNVAGFIPGGADKCTFGHTWRVVLAEHEAACAELNWPTLAADRGFERSASVVTLSRFTSGGTIGSIYGDDPERIAAYLADGLTRHTSWELIFTVGFAPGTYAPMLVLSPMVAKTLVRAGWTKADLRERLFALARMPAHKFEAYIGEWTNFVPGRPTLCDLVARGEAAQVFAQSEDPERMVPIVATADDFMIVVSGDPMRSNAYALASNGMHGFPTSRVINGL